MSTNVLARLAALKTMPMANLKEEWRAPSPANRPATTEKFLKSRLAYRVQELTYGGLETETLTRLRALTEQLDNADRRRAALEPQRPIAVTRLIREWQGVEHAVTVRDVKSPIT